jgi:hypothetical protein
LLAGEQWEPQLSAVLRGSQHLVVLWSKEAAGSEWVLRETSTFDADIYNKRAGGAPVNRRMLFILLEEGKNPPFSSLQMINELRKAKSYAAGSDQVDQNLWMQVVSKVVEAVRSDDTSRPIIAPNQPTPHHLRYDAPMHATSRPIIAPNQPTPPIFVSHSNTDHHFCLQLVNDLQRALGDEEAVWYDAGGGLQGGDTWWRKIMQELKARHTFIVVLSPDSVASNWVNTEIDLAWRQKHSQSGKLIIPLLYRQCEIRDDLDLLQIISFLEPTSYEEAFNELLIALGISKNTI